MSTIACGSSHTAAVSRDQSAAFTWGAGAHGQLGLGSESNAHTPSRVVCPRDLNIVAAACGYSHTIFLVSNGRFTSALECGESPFAEAPSDVAMLPVQVQLDGRLLVDVVQVFAGAQRSGAVLENGRLLVWQRTRHCAPRLQPFGGGENVTSCVAAALGKVVSYLGAVQ